MKTVLSLMMILLLGFFVTLHGEGRVNGTEARALVQNGATLVDVRTTQEFSTGHIPGAVNIPVQDLERRMPELGSKDEPIVVYCRSGNRSGRARRLLESAGYLKVHDLGPMERW